MTHEQITMARALATVKMVPGIPTKRFAREMAETANLAPATVLTQKQAQYLAECVVRFRVQIPDKVVALARAALPPEEVQP